MTEPNLLLANENKFQPNVANENKETNSQFLNERETFQLTSTESISLGKAEKEKKEEESVYKF
jgi:hypothetical protein